MFPPSDAENQEGRLRLGVVDYLNMQPLVAGLEGALDGVAELWHAEPSRLAGAMDAGEIDVGMVPVASLLRHPEWSVVRPARGSGSMIGSRGAVRSLFLIGVGEPASWRRLRPDAHSMNTNALAQILLRRKYGVEPLELAEPIPMDDWEPEAPPPEGEAWVLIGSRALRWRDFAKEHEGARALDLGAEWTGWTGLPLVCAVWAARAGLDPARLEALAARLEMHKLTNRPRLPAIAAGWRDLAYDRLSAAKALEYCTKNIDYALDAEALKGLERFREEGAALGLF